MVKSRQLQLNEDRRYLEGLVLAVEARIPECEERISNIHREWLMLQDAMARAKLPTMKGGKSANNGGPVNTKQRGVSATSGLPIYHEERTTGPESLQWPTDTVSTMEPNDYASASCATSDSAPELGSSASCGTLGDTTRSPLRSALSALEGPAVTVVRATTTELEGRKNFGLKQ